MTNAFDSPSIIQYAKDPKISGDPFKSPAIRVNGGRTDSTLCHLDLSHIGAMCVCMYVRVAGAIDPRSSPSVVMLNRAGTETYNAMESPAVVFLGIEENKVCMYVCMHVCMV